MEDEHNKSKNLELAHRNHLYSTPYPRCFEGNERDSWIYVF